MKKELSAQDLLRHIQQKIDSEDYNDSVHKITLITARDVIAKVLRTDFNY